MAIHPRFEEVPEQPPEKAPEWPAITTAYQPIVERATGRVVAYEALVRSADGRGAADVMRDVSREKALRFDQHCRDVAVEEAARLDRNATLSLNVRYFDTASCLESVRQTLAHAQAVGLAGSHLSFEITETTRVVDTAVLARALRERTSAWRVLLDDFGTGPSGVTLLEKLRPDAVKLDRALVHGIADKDASRTIVRWVMATAARMRVQVIAKGVERPQDLEVLSGLGIGHFQGYLFAPPAVGRLPVPTPQPLRYNGR